MVFSNDLTYSDDIVLLFDGVTNVDSGSECKEISDSTLGLKLDRVFFQFYHRFYLNNLQIWWW